MVDGTNIGIGGGRLGRIASAKGFDVVVVVVPVGNLLALSGIKILEQMVNIADGAVEPVSNLATRTVIAVRIEEMHGSD